MSRRSAGLLLATLCLPASACWEQIDDGAWFPQMKRQPAVQAWEEVGFQGRVEAFSPPEGSVPIGGGEAPVSTATDDEANRLTNPVPADLPSLENGRLRYEENCAACHGHTGLADGPVSKVFVGVFPLVGIVKARTDGHIYTTIRYGRRRMPGYGRISSRDRWDLVNYVRYLDQKGGRP